MLYVRRINGNAPNKLLIVNGNKNDMKTRAHTKDTDLEAN